MKSNIFSLLCSCILLLALGACNPKQTGTNGGINESGMTSTSTFTETDTTSADEEIVENTLEEDTTITEETVATTTEETASETETIAENVSQEKEKTIAPAPKKEAAKPEPAYQPSQKPAAKKSTKPVEKPAPQPQAKPTPKPQAKPTPPPTPKPQAKLTPPPAPTPIPTTTTQKVTNTTTATTTTTTTTKTETPTTTTTTTARPADDKFVPRSNTAKPTSRPKTTLEQAMENKGPKPLGTSASSGRATITIASGGGFTGATTSFQIRPDGKVIKTNSLKPDATKIVKTLSSNELNEVYNQLDQLELQKVKFSHPGNMTYSIKVESDAYRNNVRWGSADHQVPANIQQYYDAVMKIIGK